MDAAMWAALGAIAMALINAVSSVLTLLIRARYQWHDGIGPMPVVNNDKKG